MPWAISSCGVLGFLQVMTTKAQNGIKFIQRVYLARALGLALGGLAVGIVLLPLEPAPLLWVLVFYNSLVWPHIAYIMSSRSQDRVRQERLQLLGDTLCGGFWVAAIGFNPLVSTLVTMMLWMNNIAAGGAGLFVRGLALWLLGVAAGLVLLGFKWYPEVNSTIVYASIPVLLGYPLLIGFIAYGLAMDLHAQRELLRRLSRTDGLTGLFNRSYWEIRTKEEVAKARRNHLPLSLIILDVDHFKQINDTYGHAMGDQVLQQVAQYLQWNLRESELLGRYGGEEFVIVLPGTPKSIAFKTAERLRDLIAQAEFMDINNPKLVTLRCTISLGVAAFSDGLGDFSSWMRVADKALYEAKRQGRNRTVAAQEKAAVALEDS